MGLRISSTHNAVSFPAHSFLNSRSLNLVPHTKSAIPNPKSQIETYQLDFTTPGIWPWRARSRRAMRDTPNFRRYPRVLPDCEQRFRTRLGLPSRGIFCNWITAASTSSGVDLGLLMIFFAAARRSRQRATRTLRFSFFTTLLIFAINLKFRVSCSEFRVGFATRNPKLKTPNYCLNGIPNDFRSDRAWSSVFAVVMIEMFIPRVLSTLLKSISGKINCSRTPSV